MIAHTPTKEMLPRLQRSAIHAFAPLQREMTRVLEELGDGWDAFAHFQMAPAMDVADTKDGLEFSLELPGLSRDDVKITVDEDLLTVSGEKKGETQTKDREYRLTERSYGEFSRTVRLPASVDASRITAVMKDGVLKVLAPRRQDASAKRIQIQAA